MWDFIYFWNYLHWTILLKFNIHRAITFTEQSNWSWRSKEHGRSVDNQQHIDNIEFAGEICLFLNNQSWNWRFNLKFNNHRTIKLELKEQRTWQKHWQSTTHWQHWIWWWDLFIFWQSTWNQRFNLKFNIHSGIELEMKEQRTWQRCWKSTTHWQHCIWGWDLFIFWTINLEINDYWNATFTENLDWRWRSKEHGRSIGNQQHIDNIEFAGEICLFFELEIDDLIWNSTFTVE